LFVEPEGWNTVEIYVNGFSTSLPEEVQIKALRTVPVSKNVKYLDLVMPLNTIFSTYTTYTHIRNKTNI
jgi:tRNA uridine 5-carboxymethylaminomethyl modification enzyme